MKQPKSHIAISNISLIIIMIGVIILAVVIGSFAIALSPRSSTTFTTNSQSESTSTTFQSPPATTQSSSSSTTTSETSSSSIFTTGSSTTSTRTATSTSTTTSTTSTTRTTTTSTSTTSSSSSAIPSLTLSPNSGMMNQKVTFTFNGGTPNSQYYLSSDYAIFGYTPFTTNSLGSYTGTIIAADPYPSTYNITITSSSSNMVVAEASFTVPCKSIPTIDTSNGYYADFSDGIGDGSGEPGCVDWGQMLVPTGNYNGSLGASPWDLETTQIHSGYLVGCIEAYLTIELNLYAGPHDGDSLIYNQTFPANYNACFNIPIYWNNIYWLVIYLPEATYPGNYITVTSTIYLES